MIVVFTDYGVGGPYTGQLHAALRRDAPDVAIIDLFSDLPAFQTQPAAYLLAAYSQDFPAGTVFLCVVDPGVGSDRAGLCVNADHQWFVGPDNGLFELVIRRARVCIPWRITWRPVRLSATFHGRDVFAPLAARLARGLGPEGLCLGLEDMYRPPWPDDLSQVIYIDRFGNAVTGLRANVLAPGSGLKIGASGIHRARTFGDVKTGSPLCYENANGLMEIAVNQGRADAKLGLHVGSEITIWHC